MLPVDPLRDEGADEDPEPPPPEPLCPPDPVLLPEEASSSALFCSSAWVFTPSRRCSACTLGGGLGEGMGGAASASALGKKGVGTAASLGSSDPGA